MHSFTSVLKKVPTALTLLKSGTQAKRFCCEFFSKYFLYLLIKHMEKSVIPLNIIVTNNLNVGVITNEVHYDITKVVSE